MDLQPMGLDSGMRREILLVLLSSFLAGTTMALYKPIWPFLVKEAGVDAATYGIIASGANMLEFIVRWGFAAYSSPSLTFLIGSLGISLSSGLLLLGATPALIFTSLALARMGRALHVMGRNQVTSLLFRKKVGTAFSSVRVSWQVGSIIGPAAGAALVALATQDMVLSLGLLLGLMSAALILPMVRRFGTRGKGRISFWRGSLTPEIKSIVAVTVINNFARNSFIPFHLVMAPAIFGARVEHIAMAAVIETLTSTLAGVPVGWLSDSLGDRRLILSLSELFMVLGIAVYIVPGAGIPGFLLSSFLLGLGMSSYAPIVTAAVSEMAPRDPQDAVAFLSTAISLSRLPAPLVTSALIAARGYPAAFSFSAACLALVGLYMGAASVRSRAR